MKAVEKARTREMVGKSIAAVGHCVETLSGAAMALTGPVGGAAGAYLMMDGVSGLAGLANPDLDFVGKGHEHWFGKTGGQYSRAITGIAVGLAPAGSSLLNAARSGMTFDEIYSGLEKVKNAAVKQVDSSQANLLLELPPGYQAMYRNGKMVDALRGKAVENAFRRMISQDPKLMEYMRLGKLNKGPDVFLNNSDIWFDLTTSKEWFRHVNRGYAGGGFPLITD